MATDDKTEFEAKQEQEKRLRLLSLAVDQNSEGMAIVDLEGHILFVNRSFAQAHGYNPEEMLGKHLSVFHTPEQMLDVENNIQQIQETGEFRGEIWHLRRDGTVFPTSMYNTLLRNDSGIPIAMVGTLQDTTQQQAAAQALKDSEQRYRTLFEQAADAIVLIDGETGRLVEFNDRAHENLGYGREEFQNFKIADIEVIESEEQIAEHMTKILTEGADSFETRHRTKSGEIRDILVSSRVLSLQGRNFVQSIWRDVTESKQAEKKLTLSEEMLRLILNATSDLVFLTDTEGIILTANETGAKSLGTTLNAMIGSNAFDFFSSDVSESRRAQRDILLRSREPVRFQDERRGRVFDCRLYPIHKTHGDVECIAVFVSDITELRQAEESLRESERRYRAVFDSSIAGILIADVETKKFTHVNPAACRMLGYTQHELERLEVADIHPREDVGRVVSVFEAQAREEVQVGAGLPCQRKDGTIFYADISAAPILIDGRECNVGFFTDVTERIQAEEEIRKFKTITDQASYGAALSDFEGNLLYVNHRFAEMHGGSQEDFIGHHLSACHNEEQLPRVDDLNERLRREGRFVAEEVWHTKRDGTVFPTLMNGAVIADVSGRPSFLSATAVDMTEHRRAEQEWRRMEEQLRHNQKMEAVGQLAAGVAHEFNNLLVGIMSNAELLFARSKGGLPEGFKEPLEDIRRSGNRAATLTKQLLSFSKKTVSHVNVFDLNRVLDRAEHFFKQLVGLNTTLEVIQARDPCLIRADEGELEQVLANLVINARDAMPHGGTVTIRTAKVTLAESQALEGTDALPRSHIELSVTDTGCGMSAETIERIFEPFFTTKPGSERAGLGLATVFAIVKRAGGHVTVESSPDEGAVFRLYFPLADGKIEDAKTDADGLKGKALSGSETILVCDDEEVVRRSLSWLLESGGYTVLTADSGQRALELASSHEGPISLLLTDVIMPEMNGRELAEELTRRCPDIRVIYMSGYASDVLDAGGTESESFEFLQKPSTSSALFQCVRKVLEKTKGDAQ